MNTRRFTNDQIVQVLRPAASGTPSTTSSAGSGRRPGGALARTGLKDVHGNRQGAGEGNGRAGGLPYLVLADAGDADSAPGLAARSPLRPLTMRQ